jgi:GH15 family glucan-1,4-alpha-glucosidase
VTATTITQRELDALVRRSLDVIADHQDVGGAYPASPTFPVYQFSWFRDGAFIADAMSRAGRTDSADRFFAWCATIINDRSEVIEDLTTRARNGQPVAREEHLPTRYTLGGDPTGEDWWDFQLDGYGTWMFMLAAHLARHGRTADPNGTLALAVGRCCDYLCEFWRQPCFDWWEEHVDGVHVSTLAAIEAGLRAAVDHGLLTGTRLDRARATAASIVAYIEQHGIVDGRLVKTIGTGDRVDASLIAAFVPFRTFDPDGDLAARTYRRIVEDLAPDGVHRYLGDTYFGGGRWVVLAGFLGAFEAVTGRTDEARRRLVWMHRQQTDSGLLPEQILDDPLDERYVNEWIQRWGPVATPLLWSHAMYITLADELERCAS